MSALSQVRPGDVNCNALMGRRLYLFWSNKVSISRSFSPMIRNIIFLVLGGLSFTAQAAAREIVQADADHLAGLFLEKCNQREGVEYFGGKSDLSDYECKKSYSEIENCTVFEYRSVSERSPKYFNVYIKTFENYRLDGLGKLAPELSGKLDSVQQIQFIETFPLKDLFKWTYCYYDEETVNIYTLAVDKNKNVTKTILPSLNICSVMQQETLIDIFLGPGFRLRPDEYQPYKLTLRREDNHWKAISEHVRFAGKKVREFTEPFVCFGEFIEKDVLAVLDVLGSIEDIGRISGIDFYGEDYASVYFGQGDAAFPFGSPYLGLPRIHFRCVYKDGQWRLLMQSVIHCDEYDKRCELFVAEQPTENIVINEIKWDPWSETPQDIRRQFEKKEWAEVFRMMHRFQWFEKKNHLIVDIPGVNKVTICCFFKDSNPPTLTFQKKNGHWLYLESNHFFYDQSDRFGRAHED